MSGKEQRPLVPRLRFPEFRAKDGWGCEFGNLIFDQISNKNHNSDLPVLAITQEQGAIPREMIDYHVSVTDKSLESYKVVEVGDFIISLRSFQGGIEFSRYRGICSPAYVVLRLRHNHSEDYFRHYLKTERFIAQMTKNLEGLRDGKMISHKQFSELELPIPPRNEQQKIADCLSSLDEVIAAENQKLETLKTYKKGLMQQMFPREGETVPRLRFPEFYDIKENKFKPLNVLAKFSSGGTPSKTEPAYWGGDIPWISASSMHDMNISDADLRVTAAAIGNGTRLAKKGAILILVRGSMLFKRVPICIALRDVAFNQDVKALTVTPDVVSVFLLYQLISLSSRIAVNETGIGAGKIETEILEGLKIWVPDTAEQQRIANCLSSLDDLITTQAEKVEALKDHKKGLMQQLFPVLDEVPA